MIEKFRRTFLARASQSYLEEGAHFGKVAQIATADN
jgi:hypothetical protein